MLRTDRTSGHYHLDEMVNYFCHMSSVRGTSDGRGPVTRTRVPDRDEQGKPSEDARRGRCHPLEAGIYPCGCHRYRDTQLPSTKYQVPGLHFVPWHRGSGCLGAAAPVTGAAADEYNLNVVDCNASVTVARRSSISVSGGLGGTPSRRRQT